MNNVDKLNKILESFRLPAVCLAFSEYKNAYFYDVELKPGGRVRDLEKFSVEFSLALKTPSRPRMNIIPESGIVRFEFMKAQVSKINLMELGNNSVRPKGELTCLMGETLSGDSLWMDLASNPHMLIAGCTGSGKSTVLHTIIANLLLYPQIKIHLMDPKNVEFFKYEKISRVKVSYSFDECLKTLKLLNDEMDNRYNLIKKNKIDIKSLSYTVLIIDEFADLRIQDTNNLFHKQLCRLAQKSRAAKIHIILATQRPSANVLDGTIKANFPARLSCKVSSGIDSKIVLDATGAEDLTGCGDSIINSNEFNFQRFQSAYTNADMVCKYFNKVERK